MRNPFVELCKGCGDEYCLHCQPDALVTCAAGGLECADCQAGCARCTEANGL